MLFIYLNLLSLSSFPISMRENIIKSNCEFEIIRFKKNDIDCMDYGKYVSYCNHYAMPEEFTVLKEKGINYKEIITIKPYAIYEKSNNNKIKLADFYYDFKCNKEDNEAKLYLTIVPLYDQFDFINIFQLLLIILFTILLFSVSTVSNNFQRG